MTPTGVLTKQWGEPKREKKVYCMRKRSMVGKKNENELEGAK